MEDDDLEAIHRRYVLGEIDELELETQLDDLLDATIERPPIITEADLDGSTSVPTSEVPIPSVIAVCVSVLVMMLVVVEAFMGRTVDMGTIIGLMGLMALLLGLDMEVTPDD